VTHRGAGKTVACVEHLQHAATVHEVRPRFAYISPFLKQSKTVARDYLRAATAPLRKYGARVHESKLASITPTTQSDSEQFRSAQGPVVRSVVS
jgi:hypothetical protein